ncbi:MAG: efflux RND transporter periplasmic adaptor subunit [Clostridiales Family XIII bacterium]|nr:efflux RND transporter periplasmic adaptor subunit [Clostridiales Family XIII bacterium]
MSRKILIVIVVLVIAVLAAIAGGRYLWDYLHPEAEAVDSAVSIRVATAQIGDVEITSIHTGKVESENEVGVVSKVAGKVAAVSVSVGDTVSAGDVLFKIDPVDLQGAANQAQIQLDGAMQARSTAQDAINVARGPIDSANKIVDDAHTLVNNAQTAVNDALAAAGGNSSDPTVIAAQGALASAQGALAGAQAQLDATRAAVENSLGYIQLKSALEQVDVQVQLAIEGVAAVSKTAADLSVRSPIDGVVTTLAAQAGGMVSQTMLAAVITNPNNLRITTSVSESMIDNIHAGDVVKVFIRSISQEDPFTGRISAVLPAPPQGQTTYPVYVELGGADERIKAGMFVEVSLVSGRATGVVMIPSEAVIVRTDRLLVAVVGADDKIRFAEVVTGLDNGVQVEIKSGISAGDRIVYEGQYYVDEESEISIVE